MQRAGAQSTDARMLAQSAASPLDSHAMQACKAAAQPFAASEVSSSDAPFDSAALLDAPLAPERTLPAAEALPKNNCLPHKRACLPRSYRRPLPQISMTPKGPPARPLRTQKPRAYSPSSKRQIATPLQRSHMRSACHSRRARQSPSELPPTRFRATLLSRHRAHYQQRQNNRRSHGRLRHARRHAAQIPLA